MMNTRALSLITILGVTLIGSAAQAQILDTIDLGAGARPESITKAWNGQFYVSCQGPSGNLGANDGEIRRVDLATHTVTPFVSGLDNPRGVAFVNGFLVVADQVRLWKIDQNGNKSVLAEASQFPFPAVFFNDVSPATSNSVYVVEMGRRDIIRIGATPPAPNVLIPVDSDAAYAVPATSRIYKVTLNGQITNVFEPSRKLLVMNGVCLPSDSGGLLATDFFHGNIVHVRTAEDKKSIIATAFRGADGLAQGSDGTIYVSSFENGQVWRMDANGENQKQLLGGQGFQSVADFYLDEPAQRLYVPKTPTHQILVISTNPQ